VVEKSNLTATEVLYFTSNDWDYAGLFYAASEAIEERKGDVTVLSVGFYRDPEEDVIGMTVTLEHVR